MKKVFLESNGYNMVGFVFDDGMVAFRCETIEDAVTMDCSGVEGCKTAEEAAIDCNTEVYPFNEDEWECVTLIGDDNGDMYVIVPDSYYLTTGHRYIGSDDKCYFGELSDGSPDANDSIKEAEDNIGYIGIGDYIVKFEVIEWNENNDYMDSIVKVLDIER